MIGRVWWRIRRYLRRCAAGDETPTPIIRTMYASDFGEVLGIERQIYEFPWPRRTFEKCLRSGYCCLLVCERGAYGRERVSAYGIVDLDKPRAHICNISVAEDRQRRGLGRLLVNKLLDEASSRKAVSAYLEVRPSNHAARAFYRKLGFSQVGVRRGYYRSGAGQEDALIYHVAVEQ